MRDSGAGAEKLIGGFNERKADNEKGRRNGQNSPNIYARTRKQNGKHQQNAEHGARSSEQKNIVHSRRKIHGKGQRPGHDSGKKIHKHKFFRTQGTFNGNAEKYEAEHIADQMHKVRMHEHVRYELPIHMRADNQSRIQRQIDA